MVPPVPPRLKAIHHHTFCHLSSSYLLFPASHGCLGPNVREGRKRKREGRTKEGREVKAEGWQILRVTVIYA
jgi:hypothetical protein